MTDTNHADIVERTEQIIGYRFVNDQLLALGLTHASVAEDRLASNERMEFLGDAVLGAAVLEGDAVRAPGGEGDGFVDHAGDQGGGAAVAFGEQGHAVAALGVRAGGQAEGGEEGETAPKPPRPFADSSSGINLERAVAAVRAIADKRKELQRKTA